MLMVDYEGLELRNRTEQRVRYGDTDKMGIVYNGNYFYFFEIGRTELFREFGLPYSTFEENGIMLPLIESRAFYHQPAVYDDLLTIETVYVHNSGPRPRFDYNIVHGDKSICTGYTIHSYMNSKTRRPGRPPEFFIEFLKKHSERKSL
jgi:acyl-CoA thioester hydrolase